MNFQEVVDEVISITKRPDKLADIRREVNKAINFYCIETNFARDREEQLVVLDAFEYIQSLDLSLFQRFRKIEAIIVPYRKEPLEHTAPDKLFTKGGCDQKDAYYVAGEQINLSLSQLAVSCKVAYFKYPPTLSGTQTFWLLETSPYMIIDKAAAGIFLNIGDDTSGRHHKSLADEAYVSAKRDYKYGASYG